MAKNLIFCRGVEIKFRVWDSFHPGLYDNKLKGRWICSDEDCFDALGDFWNWINQHSTGKTGCRIEMWNDMTKKWQCLLEGIEDEI